jgi:hypothetical protein
VVVKCIGHERPQEEVVPGRIADEEDLCLQGVIQPLVAVRGLSAPLAQRGGAPIRGVYAAYAPYDPKEDRYTLYADVQYPHRVRNALASSIFRVPWGDLGSTTLVELEQRFVQWVGRVTLRGWSRRA